jgi:hypothetical protein
LSIGGITLANPPHEFWRADNASVIRKARGESVRKCGMAVLPNKYFSRPGVRSTQPIGLDRS